MNTESIQTDTIKIDYLTESLRIIGCTPKGGENFFADINHRPPVQTPFGEFFFRGGHRLWHSPEAMPRNYIPDNGPLIINKNDNEISLEIPPEPITGIRKKISLLLDTTSPKVTVTHTLINDGIWPIELAPWAITQYKTGGVVVLPMPKGNSDPDGLLPNRQISFWPYADIQDDRLKLDNDHILFHAKPIEKSFKMGYFNPHGWLAYVYKGKMFKKSFNVDLVRQHPDGNCNTELYGINDFVEMETLSSLVKLEPNTSVQHTEIWEIFNGYGDLAMNVVDKIKALESHN